MFSSDGELGGHLEVQDVAGVVLHDVQDAGAAVDRLGGEQHLVRHRGGEDLAGTGRVEHAEPDEAAVQRLVAGAAAGDQADLAGRGTAGAGDDLVLDVDRERRVRGGDAPQGIHHDVVGGVDELLHAETSSVTRDDCAGTVVAERLLARAR